MIRVVSALFIIFINFCCQAQEDSAYYFAKGDPNGTGKWYMGREIAHVMGFHGKDWLERKEREKEEKTSKLIKNLDLNPADVVADIGAGSGYHVFRMAPELSEGKVYAVDIQPEMLEVMRGKIKKDEVENVELIKGDEKTTNLPDSSIDKVLMVDVYHEFSYPYEMLESIKRALKPDGRVYLVEFRKEDDWVPIKEVHKMTEEQAVKEFEASGFVLEKNIGNLPWQHCMVFRIP